MGQMTIEQQRALAMANARMRAAQAAEQDAQSASDLIAGENPDQIPGARTGGFLSDFGAGVANLADVTVGNVIPSTAGTLTYTGARALQQTPEQAAQLQQQVSGALDKPFGKAFGITESPAYTNAGSQQIMDFIGQNVGKGATWISQQTGLPPTDVENMIGLLSLAMPKVYSVGKNVVNAAMPMAKNALSAVNESPAVQAVRAPFKDRAAQIATKKSNESYANANRIEAAQKASSLGIALNPAESNPTTMNKVKSVVAGQTDLNDKLSVRNQPKWTSIAIEDMGLPSTTTLNAKAFDTALDMHSKPYNTVRKIPQLQPDANVIKSVGDLYVEPGNATIGGEASAKAVNKLVSEAIDKISAGRSGEQIVNDIRKLRRDANNIYRTQEKSGIPDATRIDLADANLKIAKQLENLIDANVNDPKLLGEIRAARAAQAKVYDYERATDIATGKVDPAKLAKMLSENKPLSGKAADMAAVAANFPDIANIGTTNTSVTPRLTRSGVGGTVGFVAGSTVGQPFAGAALGAGAGLVASELAARRIGSPAYQAKHAVPQDFRLPINNLAEQAAPTSNLPAIFDVRNALSRTPPPQTGPNWVFGRTQPEVNVGEQNIIPKLGAPSAESTMQGVQQRRQYDYNLQKYLDEQQQKAQEGVPRAKTGEGILFDLDPITGKLRSVSQGMKGATPDTLVSTGHSLKSAAEKVANGQNFALSAEEKIAWDKTRTDVSLIGPEFKKLTSKQIAERSMDRVWVEDTINKARAKAAAFDEIAKRAENAQAIREAKANREKMLDLLESLENNFGKPRASSSGVQGPKTREAIRNNMIENRDIKNNLGK